MAMSAARYNRTNAMLRWLSGSEVLTVSTGINDLKQKGVAGVHLLEQLRSSRPFDKGLPRGSSTSDQRVTKTLGIRDCSSMPPPPRLAQSARSRLRRERLCKVGDTPGFQGGHANRMAVISGDIDNRDRTSRGLEAAPHLDP